MNAERLWQLAVQDVEEFRTLCERLRKLGVVKLGPLVLGPLPVEAREVKPLTEVEIREKEERAQKRHMDIALAATSLRPPAPHMNGASRLHNAVLRRPASEAQPNGAKGK